MMNALYVNGEFAANDQKCGGKQPLGHGRYFPVCVGVRNYRETANLSIYFPKGYR
jgi:hypothetical protein